MWSRQKQNLVRLKILRHVAQSSAVQSVPRQRLHLKRQRCSLLQHPSLTYQDYRISLLSTQHPYNGVRTISTYGKRKLTYQLRFGLYWSVVISLGLTGIVGSYVFLREDWLERQYPSPKDWKFLARHNWRKAKDYESQIALGKGITDASLLSSAYGIILVSCESEGIFNGTPLQTNQHFDDSIPGINRAKMLQEGNSIISDKLPPVGKDISAKSEEWKQAYFESLMGVARVAEALDDSVADTKRHIIFPKDQVIGPSNPNPKSVWPGSPRAPREEDCERACDSPSFCYRRILTTKGLNDDQRIQAGLGYAAWLGQSGDQDTSLKLYHWCLDLACSSLGWKAEEIIDRQKGLFKTTAPFVTHNLLNITTDLASFYARTGDITKSLNMYLSILRARRASPEAQAPAVYRKRGPDLSLRNPGSFIDYLCVLPFEPGSPILPSSRSNPFERDQRSDCDEAGILVHVGEILFAASRYEEGLRWTRESIDISERGHLERNLKEEDRHACTDCFEAGLDNWYKMAQIMVNKSVDRAPTSATGASTTTQSQNVFNPMAWLRPSFGSKGKESAYEDWVRELDAIDQKRSQFKQERLMAGLGRQTAAGSSLVRA